MVGETTGRPARPFIPKLHAKRGATVYRTGRRIFRYCVRYSMGIAIPERQYSSHLTLVAAERAARRFIKGPKVDGEVVGRFGEDEAVADRRAIRAIMDRKP